MNDSQTKIVARKKKYTKEQILDLFITYVDEEGLGFDNEAFCLDHSIQISQFRELLLSVEEAEKSVWEELMRAALQTVTSDTQFETFTIKDKLLSVYYTFFENCGLNSGFCKESIKYHGKLGMIPVLKNMKVLFVEFVKDNFPSSKFPVAQYSEKVNQLGGSVQSEAVYGQLLFLLDFWSRDTSIDYEKTDIAIEKAVKALTDLIDITPIKSLIDFGKFIWQERFQNR